MTDFRIHYVLAGGHVHIRVFVGPSKEATHAKCGDLIMSPREFEDFKNGTGAVEFVKDAE